MLISVRRVVEAPIAEVWDDLSRLATHAEWMADADLIDIVSSVDRGVGTVMRVPTTIGPFRTEDWIIVTEWIEGSRIGVEHIGIVGGSGSFELVEVDAGTEFLWEEELMLPALLAAAAPVASIVIEWVWKRNLGRFAARFGSAG